MHPPDQDVGQTLPAGSQLLAGRGDCRFESKHLGGDVSGFSIRYRLELGLRADENHATDGQSSRCRETLYEGIPAALTSEQRAHRVDGLRVVHGLRQLRPETEKKRAGSACSPWRRRPAVIPADRRPQLASDRSGGYSHTEGVVA